jgi:hypothetical protein
LHAALRPATAHQIDISGVGQLRLTVQLNGRFDVDGAVAVRLLAGSTLWPRLMLLRLGPVGDAPGPACRIVAVLPGSVTPEAFRALAVALGAGSGRLAMTSTENKIL